MSERYPQQPESSESMSRDEALAAIVSTFEGVIGDIPFGNPRTYIHYEIIDGKRVRISDTTNMRQFVTSTYPVTFTDWEGSSTTVEQRDVLSELVYINASKLMPEKIYSRRLTLGRFGVSDTVDKKPIHPRGEWVLHFEPSIGTLPSRPAEVSFSGRDPDASSVLDYFFNPNFNHNAFRNKPRPNRTIELLNAVLEAKGRL